MPFYYLFIPTWIFTIIVFILTAGKYGAKESYLVKIEQEHVRNEIIAKYQF